MTTDADEEEETGNNIIPYDARALRTKLLMGLLFLSIKAEHENDTMAWFKSLKSMYYMCFPYVDKKNSGPVKDVIDDIKNWLSLNPRSYDPNILTFKLENLQELTMDKFKDQFMQVTKDESGEFDVNEALGFK